MKWTRKLPPVSGFFWYRDRLFAETPIRWDAKNKTGAGIGVGRDINTRNLTPTVQRTLHSEFSSTPIPRPK